MPCDCIQQVMWLQKRFGWARIIVYDTYIAILMCSKQAEKVWYATLQRQYTGAFEALYLSNSACIQPAYPFYLDHVILSGGDLRGQP